MTVIIHPERETPSMCGKRDSAPTWSATLLLAFCFWASCRLLAPSRNIDGIGESKDRNGAKINKKGRREPEKEKARPCSFLYIYIASF